MVNCKLYLFPHPTFILLHIRYILRSYGVGFNYTGGLLQWAAPWVPQYSPLLNIPPFNFPVLTQCQGLISPDQNCLHFNVLTGSSIANLLCSSASVTLRNISFVYTIVVQGSTNVIITVDGVVVSNKLISSSYNGGYEM